MNLCDDHHEQICFEGRKCPLCASIDELQKEISGLEDTVDQLEQTISDLNAELEATK